MGPLTPPTAAPLTATPINVSLGTNTPVLGGLDMSTMNNRAVRRYLRAINPRLSSEQVWASAKGLRYGYNSGLFGTDGKLKPEDPTIAALNGSQEEWDAFMKKTFGASNSQPILPSTPKYDIQPITPTLVPREPSPEELRERARLKRYAGYAQAAKDAGITDVKAMQQQLLNAGYNIGAVDGIWGAKSLAAYAQWKATQTPTVTVGNTPVSQLSEAEQLTLALNMGRWTGVTPLTPPALSTFNYAEILKNAGGVEEDGYIRFDPTGRGDYYISKDGRVFERNALYDKAKEVGGTRRGREITKDNYSKFGSYANSWELAKLMGWVNPKPVSPTPYTPKLETEWITTDKHGGKLISKKYK